MFATPTYYANVERIFSNMNIQWTDERNQIKIETFETILQVQTNFNVSRSEMYYLVLNKNELLKLVKSNSKYNNY